MTFLQDVLRITSEALRERRSLRLVRDEVQAALLERLQESQQGTFALAADHAAMVVAMATMLFDSLLRLRAGEGEAYLASVATRAKRWESKADDIVSAARDAQRQRSGADAVSHLLAAADDAADSLEDAAFLMPLLPWSRCCGSGG